MWKDRSFSQYDSNGYPVLRLGYADVLLLGRWSGITNALYSLFKDRTLWVQYKLNTSEEIKETYTLLEGIVEIEYEGNRRLLNCGETIDASYYEKTIGFHAKENAEILIRATASDFEPDYFETQILQEEANEIAKLDGYTYMHCNRIKDYSIKVWRHLGLPKERLAILRWGAYFHDVGKRDIPIEILNKPGKFTPNEWEIMKSHTTKGAQIMREHEVEWLKDAAFIVEQHHERYDGNGYPNRLVGDEISLEASIVAVVDAYDAMITERVYSGARTREDAIQQLENGKGTQFNPKIVDAFIKVLASQ